jgi:hypothetical protein
MQNNHNFWIQEDASRIIVAVAGFMTSSAVQPAFMCTGPYGIEFHNRMKAYYYNG